MSRCQTWNSAFEGIAHYIEKAGFKTNKHDFKVESDLLNRYCKDKNIIGSFSERVLKVSLNFGEFKKWVKTIDATILKTKA